MIPKTRFTRKVKPIGGGKDSNLSVIIIGSKPNHKMKSYGPPSLIKDKNSQSILEIQIHALETEFSRIEVILVGGFDFDKLLKFKSEKLRLVENQNYQELNDIEDLRLGINNSVYENILILYNDIYISDGILSDITKKSTLVIDKNNRLTDNDIGVTIVDNHPTILSIGIDNPKWTKIAYFTEKENRLLRQFVGNRDNNKLFLFEAINHILEKGGEFDIKFVQKNDVLVHVENNKELEKI